MHAPVGVNIGTMEVELCVTKLVQNEDTHILVWGGEMPPYKDVQKR